MNDILLDINYDLQIENGDLVTGNSDEQHQQLLLVCNKGDFKENPTICVGVERWLKDEDDVSGLLGEIKSEFEKDGMKVNSVLLTDGKLDIDASY